MDVLGEVKRKSQRDTIEGAPLVTRDQASIPEELYNVLEAGVTAWEKMSESEQHYLTILKGLSSFTTVSEDIYWFLWKLLLYLEQYQGIVECRNYSLYNKTIQKARVRRGEFVIHVPGLEEDRPSLRARDSVDIMSVNGPMSTRGEIKYVGRDYISVAVEAVFANQYQPTQRYNICFHWWDYNLNCLNHVVNMVKKYNLMRLVFPIGSKQTKSRHEPVTWVNKNIESNPEQQQAILKILSKSSQPDPYILFGPPGTGKTSTLVEAICQIHRRNSSMRILICTPSNAAADEIVLKLLKGQIPDNAIHRMYSASRSSEDVHETIKSCSNFADNETVYLSKEVFLTKKIVIVTLATCMRVYNYELKENHFSYLFIDEAGQATEPETLIPLLVMCGYRPDIGGRAHGQVVIAGDPKQLGPSCQSRLAEPILSISMLERLMNWGPYKRTEKGYDANYVTKLVQNYRCHEAILHVPNKLFYENELLPCGGEHTRRAINWSHLPKPGFPVVFHAVKGEEQREMHSPSVCNLSEVKVIVDYVEKLLKGSLGGRKVQEEEIGIVTPYRLQRAKILQALENKRLTKISVGTVEIFQGQERDIIIMSTVRSVLYKHQGKVHIGFLSNPKRFNVAVTRAKALLIVIGNPLILQYDSCWREFMEFCVDNGACCGTSFLLERVSSKLKLQKLLGRKHEVRPKWDPNANLPVVEDPKSASNYKEPMEDGGRRRRRLPVGYVNDAQGSESSDDTMRNIEDIDYCPDTFVQSGGESEDEYDPTNDLSDGSAGDNDEESEGSGDEKTHSSYEDDDVFMTLRKRMEELGVSNDSNSD